MQRCLEGAAVVVCCALAGEFCLYLLPGKGRARVCRFVAALMLLVQLLSVVTGTDFPGFWEYPQYAEETQILPEAYEATIWDVYNNCLKNKYE